MTRLTYDVDGIVRQHGHLMATRLARDPAIDAARFMIASD